jgi:hypothetical protein
MSAERQRFDQEVAAVEQWWKVRFPRELGRLLSLHVHFS